MRYILVPLLIVLSTVLTQAQTGPACNEKAIRDAVQSQAFEYADDTYFSSGAFDKPLIGKAAYEEASKAVRSERANEQRVQHPQRVVVSSSGDLAYEYGTGELRFDERKSGKHVSLEAGYLRVWKSVDGQCKIAASMYRPMEDASK